MSVRVAINGFGRIGRTFARTLFTQSDITNDKERIFHGKNTTILISLIIFTISLPIKNLEGMLIGMKHFTLRHGAARLNSTQTFIDELGSRLLMWQNGTNPHLEEHIPLSIQLTLTQPSLSPTIRTKDLWPHFFSIGEKPLELININILFPLHWAINHKEHLILKRLLQHPFIDVNVQSKNGNTPLILAVIQNNYEAVQLILRHKDVKVNIRNNDGNSALDLAMERREQTGDAIAELLLQDPRTTI